MSISRSDWEKTFQQIRARLAHTVPPVRYPVQAPSIIGIKAGLSLVALSPEPLAGTLIVGQECYQSDSTKVTGSGTISTAQVLADVLQKSTQSATYVAIPDKTVTRAWKQGFVLAKFRAQHNNQAGTGHYQLLVDGVERDTATIQGSPASSYVDFVGMIGPTPVGTYTVNLTFKVSNVAHTVFCQSVTFDEIVFG